MSAGWLCLACGEVTAPGTVANSCPSCGHAGVPADLADEVTVRLTWHELRVLTMWAEQWAHQHREASGWMPRAVYTIADRITAQHLEREPLTLAGELAAVRGAGYDLDAPGLPGGDE